MPRATSLFATWMVFSCRELLVVGDPLRLHLEADARARLRGLRIEVELDGGHGPDLDSVKLDGAPGVRPRTEVSK